LRPQIKEKGLHKEITVNDSMFNQANSFAAVAQHLYNMNKTIFL